MGNPAAVLRGVANDNATALLVSLSAPKFSAGASSVSTTNNNVAPSASVFISNTNSAPAQVPASFSPCCHPANDLPCAALPNPAQPCPALPHIALTAWCGYWLGNASWLSATA